jgi:DNA-binding PadR family transcriptional regulator
LPLPALILRLLPFDFSLELPDCGHDLPIGELARKQRTPAPERLICTWLPANLNSFGKRTAWLFPCLNIFAVFTKPYSSDKLFQMRSARIVDAEHFGLWELSVLSVLRERAMHPYEIQRLLRLRHKDEFLRLKKGSLYHAIRRLEDAGLIAEKETTREGTRPEKTSYSITVEGEATFGGWLKKLISTPEPEAAGFAAALSFLVYLPPAEAIVSLESRAQLLQQKIEKFDQTVARVTRKIGRIFIIEREYACAIARAELAWTFGLIKAIRARKLTWDIEAILRELRQAASNERRAKKRKG